MRGVLTYLLQMAKSVPLHCDNSTGHVLFISIVLVRSASLALTLLSAALALLVRVGLGWDGLGSYRRGHEVWHFILPCAGEAL